MAQNLPPKYPLRWLAKNPESLVQAINENFLYLAGRSVTGAGLPVPTDPGLILLPDNLGSGNWRTDMTFSSTLFDCGETAGADPTLYSPQSVLSTTLALGNAGALFTFKPDVDCDPGVDVFVNPALTVLIPMKYANGKEMRAGDIKTSTRVMAFTHSDPVSTDPNDYHAQVITPLSLYGLTDVDIGDSIPAGAVLKYSGTAWVADGVSDVFLTTDDTPLETVSLTTSTDKNYLLKGTVVVRQTGGVAGVVGDIGTWEFLAAVKNLSGTASQFNSTTFLIAEKEDASWVADFTYVGADAIITVTGAIDKDLSWNTRLEYMEI